MYCIDFHEKINAHRFYDKTKRITSDNGRKMREGEEVKEEGWGGPKD